MIIVGLNGGLGNQMFQYAASRRAAHASNTVLKLDTSWFTDPKDTIKRNYLLNVFRITEKFANQEEIRNIKDKKINFLNKLLIPYYNRPYVAEKFFHFDPNFLKVKDNTYLEGHWQSERYFKDIEDIIRKEFTFKHNPSKKNKKIIEKIKNCNAVSIHIRRGDYFFDKKTKKHHGLCGLNYYAKAISLINRNFNNVRYFVFSDEPLWVKNNLKISNAIYVNCNTGKNDHEDLRLMSLCKHNIIANSTFSWWAAWLNKNKSKIVVTPEKWFNNKSINTTDLLPKDWVKVNSH